jgi:hypothetical protein
MYVSEKRKIFVRSRENLTKKITESKKRSVLGLKRGIFSRKIEIG